MSYDELYEWVEERYPDVIEDYEKWDREQQKIEDAVWSKFLETHHREDKCVTCGSSLSWIIPKAWDNMLHEDSTLFIPCLCYVSCKDGIVVTFSKGEITQQWVSEILVGGKQS